MTAGDKYSLLNCHKLTQPIQLQLSKKRISFSEFLFAFFKFRSNSKKLEKKDDPHTLCSSEFIECERRGYANA